MAGRVSCGDYAFASVGYSDYAAGRVDYSDHVGERVDYSAHFEVLPATRPRPGVTMPVTPSIVTSLA
jgi:hypothetical protein